MIAHDARTGHEPGSGPEQGRAPEPGGAHPPIRHRAAVLGSPIDHSLSPVLHRSAYEALGLRDWSYDRFAVGGAGEPTLAEFLDGLGPEWLGFSVTMPLKEEALALAVAASGHACDIGAANTLLRTEEGWIAESTDSYGLVEALLEAGVGRPGREPASAVVLGSGATARSVLDALARLGTRHVTFVVRDQVRPQTARLARRLGLTVARQVGLGRGELAALVAATDVTVSTLPTGTLLDLDPAPPGSLAGRVVLDVVYGGWPTGLARWAQAGGALPLSGLGMLVHQAVEQVRLMTGRPASAQVMRAAVLAGRHSIS